MTPGAARLSGSRLWVGASLLVTAVLVGVATLGVLLAPGGWMGHSTVVVLIVALSTTMLRRTLRSALVPSAWGTLVAVLAVTAAYGGTGRGWTIPQPTTETLDRLEVLIGSGVQSIVDGRIPVQPTPGLDLLVVAGAAACYLLADLLVLGWGRAGLGGLPIAALWLPAVLFERRPALALLALGAMTFLLLLALTHRRPLHHSSGQEATLVTATAAGLTVLALVFGSTATALPFYGSVRLPASWGGYGLTDSPLRVSTDLDMRASLDQRSDRTLLRYSTDGPVPGPLRMYTLTLFDGRQWQRGEAPSDLRRAAGRLWPSGEGDGEPGEPTEIRVTVTALNQDTLPIPADPRSIEADGTWLYDEQRDEVVGVNTTTQGLSYVISVENRELTDDALRADGAGEPPGGLAQYLQVPDSEFEEEIRTLAAEVTADATTDYARAMALQMYFRDFTTFTYSTDAPPVRTGDAVWDFLDAGSGYCVQYATAMTLMARAVGLPARMAVGFLPGQRDRDATRTWEVTARLAHTWPEIYFEDAGWVRFEPTPARQSGAPPTYADPFFGLPVPVTEDIPTGTGQTMAPGQQQGPGGAEGSGYVTIGGAEIPVPAVVAVAVALLLLAGLGGSWWARRRRMPSEPIGPDEWWDRLRATLAANGVAWSDATTPRQAALVVREGYPRDGDTTEAVVALDALVATVESERYAPRPRPWTTEELRAWVAAAERPLVVPEDEAVTSRD